VAPRGGRGKGRATLLDLTAAHREYFSAAVDIEFREEWEEAEERLKWDRTRLQVRSC